MLALVVTIVLHGKPIFVRHIKGAHVKIEDVLCPFASNSHSESSLSHESYSPIKSTKNYHATAHETGTHDDNGYQFSYIDDNDDDMDEVMKSIDVFCNFCIVFCTPFFQCGYISSQRCLLLAT